MWHKHALMHTYTHIHVIHTLRFAGPETPYAVRWFSTVSIIDGWTEVGHLPLCMYVNACTYVYVCMWFYVCMHICMNLCIYVPIPFAYDNVEGIYLCQEYWAVSTEVMHLHFYALPLTHTHTYTQATDGNPTLESQCVDGTFRIQNERINEGVIPVCMCVKKNWFWFPANFKGGACIFLWVFANKHTVSMCSNLCLYEHMILRSVHACMHNEDACPCMCKYLCMSNSRETYAYVSHLRMYLHMHTYAHTYTYMFP
jgi:hypothetical protein